MCKLVFIDGIDKMVSELKERYIRNIIRVSENYSFIDRVYLFGSSLEERCRDTSDIDLVIVGNVSKSKCLDSKKYRSFCKEVFEFDFGQDYDIIYCTDLTDLCTELQHNVREGCVIYDREQK